MMWGEAVCCDPFSWMDAGLTTNRGVFLLGQPGTGKSAAGKRITRGCMAFGVTPLFLGDPKPDYTAIVRSAGGQVIRVGRGLDRFNPLDAGPLGTALARITGPVAEQLRLEVRGRRLNATLALCALVRTDAPMGNAEETVVGAVVDLLADRLPAGVDPTIPDVLAVVREAPDRLVSAAEVDSLEEYRTETRRLRQTLRMLCEGSLKGVFDGPTTTPIDLDAPAVSIDISAVAAVGDTLLSAAMLSTWSYGFAVIDAASALADAGLAPRRRYLAVLDELWRALRGTSGLVDRADALTRVYRGRDVAHMMMTHSLDDLNALPTEADRAKARGFVDRCAITILAGLPMRELDQISRIVPLSAAEKHLVASWSSPESWQSGARHPGRELIPSEPAYRIRCPRPHLVGADGCRLTKSLNGFRPRNRLQRPDALPSQAIKLIPIREPPDCILQCRDGPRISDLSEKVGDILIIQVFHTRGQYARQNRHVRLRRLAERCYYVVLELEPISITARLGQSEKDAILHVFDAVQEDLQRHSLLVGVYGNRQSLRESFALSIHLKPMILELNISATSDRRPKLMRLRMPASRSARIVPQRPQKLRLEFFDPEHSYVRKIFQRRHYRFKILGDIDENRILREVRLGKRPFLVLEVRLNNYLISGVSTSPQVATPAVSTLMFVKADAKQVAHDPTRRRQAIAGAKEPEPLHHGNTTLGPREIAALVEP
jgi:hypothetical protein